jgi:hypothetical protein
MKEGLTDYNHIKVAYVVTTDPSCLRMTGHTVVDCRQVYARWRLFMQQFCTKYHS